MDQLTHLPWWIKIALGLGGLSMIWNFLQSGVPRVAAWALPFVIRAVRFVFDWLFAHPAMRLAIVKNKDRIEPFLKAISDAINSLLAAALAEADKMIDAEAEKEEKPPAP